MCAGVREGEGGGGGAGKKSQPAILITVHATVYLLVPEF